MSNNGLPNKRTRSRLWQFVLLACSVGLAVFSQSGDASWALSLGAGMSSFPEHAGANAALQYSPFQPAFLRSLVGYVVAAFALFLITLRLVTVMARSRASAPDALKGAQSGASVIEFVLVFPFLLALLFIIMQIALLVQAKFVVNYAAFCAVRSAVVMIPARVRSARTGKFERANRIDLTDARSPKMSIIRRAAALPCVGISPLYSPSIGVATGTAPNPSLLVPLTFVTLHFPPVVESFSVAQQFLSRAQYAYDYNNTRIEIRRDNRSGKVVDHELITVRLNYRYYLVMPFANRLLGQTYWGNWLFGSRGFYYNITEQYTLPNEGEPLYPDGQASRFKDEDEVEIFE
jgi:hypothetical protein